MLILCMAALAFVVTVVLTPVVRFIAVRQGWVSKPTETRWGRRAVARLGGSAMFAGVLAASSLLGSHSPFSLFMLGGIVLVFLLGFVDDVHRLPPYTKLVAQLLIGCFVVLGGIRLQAVSWAWLSIPISVLWFVLIINAFNLLDNMDGLAAGVGAIAAAFCAVHAALSSQWPVVALAAALCGSCLGFLCFNFPPAKIYMGDSGSHLLGFSLAALSLLGAGRHSTQLLSVLLLPTAVLAVPIFDTCFVTVQRLLHRQHPFIGGTDHVSHRLAILGLSTRQTVLVLYGLSASLGGLSVLTVWLTPLQGVVTWLCGLAVLMLVALYLSRVNVYRMASQPAIESPQPARDVTLVETMLMHKRRLLEILVDFLLLSGAYTFAHLLRFEGVLTYEYEQIITRSLPLLLFVKISCLAWSGLYRGEWKYLGVGDFLAMVKAVTVGSVLSSFTLLYLWRFQGFSRAVLCIDWMLSLLAVGGSRLAVRLLDEWIREARPRGVPTLLIGAGDTGARVLRWLKDDPAVAYRILGFLDDDVATHGTRIYGVPVLGSRKQLTRLLDELKIREVLITISDPPGELLQDIRAGCAPRSIAWRVMTAGVPTINRA